MSQTITIEPVTRIEGHAKVSIDLDDAGHVAAARLQVNEFRGFEKFCEGRLFYEMPLITPRICGICPVSHHLASVKACDQIVGAQLPRPARLLRELLHMGQVIQSHAMHFFELAGPDLLLGFDADPALRNVAGLYAANPDLAKQAIALRRFGQQIIARVGDRRIHPNCAVPGGMNKALQSADRQATLFELDSMIAIAQAGLTIMKQWMEKHPDDLATFASFPSGYLGMVDDQNTLDLYDGDLRLLASDGQQWDGFAAGEYLQHIAEHVEPWTYLKFPYRRASGWPDGVYRVGPLARLNVAQRLATPLAQKEFELFRQLNQGRCVEGTLYYHYARLIEALYALERVDQLLADPQILSQDIRDERPVTNRQGIGVLEAPRGTLIHHYWVDENGKIEKVNLIVATGHNNYAMSHAVELVTKAFIHGGEVTEGALNRIEAAIRAYDPCLSCSTHAVGQMPLEVVIRQPDGRQISITRRG